MTYGHTYSAYKDYQPQLYNVDKDPEELEDVAAENPKVVTKLEERLREELNPDEVDRRVMKDDYDRLLERFHDTAENAEERTKKMLLLVPRDYQMKFTNWLGEAKSYFGEAEPASVDKIGLMESHNVSASTLISKDMDKEKDDMEMALGEMEEATFEIGDHVRYIGQIWKQRGLMGTITESKETGLPYKVKFENDHYSWCAKTSLEQAYKVGERVERRDKGETWFTGLITEMQHGGVIKVDGLVWDEVRKLSKTSAENHLWSDQDESTNAGDQESAFALYNEQAPMNASSNVTFMPMSLLNQKEHLKAATARDQLIGLHNLSTFHREQS